MNFIYLRFLRKVLKGHSLLFSLIIALGLIGFSVSGEIRSLFGDLGISWPLAWVGSGFLVTYLAKREHRLKIGSKFKLYLCFGLIAFGLISSYLLGVYEKTLMKDIPPYDLDTSLDATSQRRGGSRSRGR